MSLQLPPERDVPDPDAMFQRILADGARPEIGNLDERRRRRTWLLPAVAAALVLVVGFAVLFRNPGETDSAVPPAAAPTASNPLTVAGTGGTAPGDVPSTSAATSFIGTGTAIVDGVKLTVRKGADDGASITAEVTACSTTTEFEVVYLSQWSLEGSTNEPIGLDDIQLGEGECKAWRVQFDTTVRPATFVFTGREKKVSWTLP